MTKKLLYLCVTALMGLFTSCSQDVTPDEPQLPASDRVTLTASLPDDLALPGAKSRALPSMEGHQLRCILEVWSKDETPVLKQRIEQVGMTGDKVVFDFKIEQGTYDCLFWADFIDADATSSEMTKGDLKFMHYPDKFYHTSLLSGLKLICYTTEGLSAFNTDAKDAFFGNYVLRKGVAAVENQTIPALTRPFAKLTVKEKSDVSYGYCSNVTVEYKRATGFNVLTGTAETNAQKVTYSGKSTEPNTLFFDYIFTDATSTLGAIELEFEGVEGKELYPVTIPAGIPLKRNHKTNVSGFLISEKTDGVQLEVTIDAEWDTPDVEHNITSVWDGTYPTSEEEAKAWMGAETSGADDATALNHVFTITDARQLAALHYLMINRVTMNGGKSLYYYDATYKLATDIDLGENPWTPIGARDYNAEDFMGVFDGQGHTVKGMNATKDSKFEYGFFAQVFGSNAIIKHLSIKGQVNANSISGNPVSVSCGGIAGMIYGDAKIAFCSFEGTISATHPNGGKVYGGGIVGSMNYGTKQVISCYSVVTEMTLTGTITKGGIVGLAENGATIKGCYWNILEGIGNDNPCGTLKSGTVTVADNGCFNTVTDLNDKVVTMNGYGEGYDYKWEVATDGGYPVLVPKN